MSRERDAFLADASAAGYSITFDPGGSVAILRRHRGTGSILRGLVLHPSGWAIDPTVPMGADRAFRGYAAFRRHLGL